MSIVFVIPGPLREYAGSRGELRIHGAATSLAEALALLWRDCPGLRDRIVDERGAMRPHVNVFVDGEDIRWAGGFATPVREGSEVTILPAISGG